MSKENFFILNNNDILLDNLLIKTNTSHELINLCFKCIENRVFKINGASKDGDNSSFKTKQNISIFFPVTISIYLPTSQKTKLENTNIDYKKAIYNFIDVLRSDISFYFGIKIEQKTIVDIIFNDDVKEEDRIGFELKTYFLNISNEKLVELKKTTKTRKATSSYNKEIIMVHEYKNHINEFSIRKNDTSLIFGRLQANIPFGNGIYMSNYSIVEESIKKYLSGRRRYDFINYIDIINASKKYFTLDTHINESGKYDMSRLQALVQIKDFEKGVFEIINFNDVIELESENETIKLKPFIHNELSLNQIFYPHPKTKDHKIFFMKKIKEKKISTVKVNFFYKDKILQSFQITNKDIKIYSNIKYKENTYSLNLEEIYGDYIQDNKIDLNLEFLDNKSTYKNIKKRELTISNLSDPIILDRNKNYCFLGRNKTAKLIFENLQFKISDDIFFTFEIEDSF